jgi:hypothetical protein
MLYRFLLFTLLVAGASAAPMTYTITGIGSGSWNTVPFSEAAFTLTFHSDTDAIVHGTSCCSGVDSTPAGTTGTANVSGFSPTAFAGDQAVFFNRSLLTAGIWHFNSPEYLTVTASAFAHDDLTSTIAPTGGTTYSYVTPLPLSTGAMLYFTSVHDVHYSQQPGNSGGEVSPVSVTPNDSTPAVGVPQTFTAVVADTAGASDVGGVDFQVLQVVGASYTPCWLYFNARTGTLTAVHQGGWAAPIPIGASGSVLTGDNCTVDTKGVTVSASGNNLSLSLPIAFTSTSDHPWNIYLAGQNIDNLSSDYSLMGTVTMPQPPPPPPTQKFQISVAPAAQTIPIGGGSADYTVTVTADGELTQPITFSAVAYLPKGYENSTPEVSFTFDPATLTGPGTTTMHVSTTPYIAGSLQLAVTGTSESFHAGGSAYLYVANDPPVITVKPDSGAGSSAKFILTWTDADNPTRVTNLNFLIAPTLDGQHACWIYWDLQQGMYLANDDGASWTPVRYGPYAYPTPTPTSNSQCTIDGANALYNDDPPRAGGNYLGYKYLVLPISFSSAFAGDKTIFVRATNEAGFDSGYQPLGTWTATAGQTQ